MGKIIGEKRPNKITNRTSYLLGYKCRTNTTESTLERQANMATPILPVEFESLDNGAMLTGTFDIKLANSFSSDSDSTYPTSSANASPEMNEDDETDLSKDGGECLGMPLCAPVAAMERSFSELSYDLQEDEHDEDDWEKLLEHLEKSDFPDVIAAPQKMKFADVKQALLKKPEKLKGSKNFTDAERKERNRIAAANSRIKRKMRLKELEVEVKRLLKIIHGKDERIATLERSVPAGRVAREGA